jgi:hypothetical protein
MALLVIQTIALNDWMMTNNELERMWKEVVVIYFLRYCPGICLEGLRKAMRNPNQESLSWARWAPTKYKSNANLLSPNYFVSILNVLYLDQLWTGDLQNVGIS